MKKILYFLLALLPLVSFTACDDNIAETDNGEFSHDWVNRNAKFFNERMADAKKAIADAQNTYGQDWENHCDWRIYRSFAKMPGGVTADSICVKITERGTSLRKTIPTEECSTTADSMKTRTMCSALNFARLRPCS